LPGNGDVRGPGAKRPADVSETRPVLWARGIVQVRGRAMRRPRAGPARGAGCYGEANAQLLLSSLSARRCPSNSAEPTSGFVPWASWEIGRPPSDKPAVKVHPPRDFLGQSSGEALGTVGAATVVAPRSRIAFYCHRGLGSVLRPAEPRMPPPVLVKAPVGTREKDRGFRFNNRRYPSGGGRGEEKMSGNGSPPIFPRGTAPFASEQGEASVPLRLVIILERARRKKNTLTPFRPRG